LKKKTGGRRHLENNTNAVVLDLESIQNVWELAIELNVDNGTNHLGDRTSADGGGLGCGTTHCREGDG